MAKLQIEADPGNTHYMEARHAVEKMLAEENAISGYHYYLQGQAIIDTSFKIYSKRDMKVMLPVLFGLITIILVFLFRSTWGALLPLLVVAFSVITTMGLSSIDGVKLNPITASVPQIVLAIGIADAIHLITVFLRELKHGVDRKNALIYTIEKNFKPCLLTSFTTTIGFLSLLISKIGPLRYFGLMVGVGAVAAFIVTFSFLPSALAVVPFSGKMKTTKETDKDGWTRKLADFVTLYPVPIIIFFVIGSTLILYFVKDVEINNNPILYFDKGTVIRDSTEFIEKNLTGTQGLEFIVDSGQPNGIKKPQYLKNLEKLQNYLESLPEIAKATSLVDIIKRLNCSMHGY